MIIIYTDQDLRNRARNKLSAELGIDDLQPELIPPTAWAEDVYFWRPSVVQAWKRRNAPLEVPAWLFNLEGVDR